MTSSPTFVAHFADGEVTRMSTHCLPNNLDFTRGVRLARHAYRSRTGREPPAISNASFVEATTGKVLQKYDAELLGAVP